MRKTFQINYEWDIVYIRSEVREMARTMGFDELDQARIVQSVSELARNVVQYADNGTISVDAVEEDSRTGLRILVQDTGPGITNFEEITKGKRPAFGETSGLQHVDMLMDEMKQIPVDSGTCVEVIKWLEPCTQVNEN